MLIALMGFIGSGKDTAGYYLEQKEDFTKDSFASSLKDLCSVVFDWPRHLLEGDTTESREWREQVDNWWASKLSIPNFTPRYALQYIGTEVFRRNFSEDIWLLTFQRRLEFGTHENVILSDCRFQNEINFFKSAGGKVVLIDDGTSPEWYEYALKANAGDQHYERIMTSDFGHVHRSEWDWIGTVPDATILNDFGTKTPDTLEIFLSRVDDTIEKLKAD